MTVSSFPIRAQRVGMTLVEMLVAMTITLIMMGVVAQLFAMMGSGMQGNRNKTELYNRLRSAAERLKMDLAGVTAPMQPPLDPGRNLGYFEYIEGKESDSNGYGALHLDGYGFPAGFSKIDSSIPTTPSAALAAYITAMNSDDRMLGDVDDVLLFTTRSTDVPFTGIHDGRVMESPVAEVMWFCRVVPGTFNPRQFNLYRRQRIVMATPAGSGSPLFPTNIEPLTTATTWANLLLSTDVACRIERGYAIPNSLGDLTKRENRFSRVATSPYNFDPYSADLTFDAAGDRGGEDVILTNCIGFDVRVLKRPTLGRYDSSTDLLLTAGDPGFASGAGLATANVSAYEDLTAADVTTAATRAAYPPYPTYDTWSLHYEYNGIDDDPTSDLNADGVLDHIIDQGTDRRDNNSNSSVDEPLEKELPPPTYSPLSGIEIRIRAIEPLTRAILQLTIRQGF